MSTLPARSLCSMKQNDRPVASAQNSPTKNEKELRTHELASAQCLLRLPNEPPWRVVHHGGTHPDQRQESPHSVPTTTERHHLQGSKAVRGTVKVLGENSSDKIMSALLCSHCFFFLLAVGMKDLLNDRYKVFVQGEDVLSCLFRGQLLELWRDVPAERTRDQRQNKGREHLECGTLVPPTAETSAARHTGPQRSH